MFGYDVSKKVQKWKAILDDVISNPELEKAQLFFQIYYFVCMLQKCGGEFNFTHMVIQTG